MLRTAPFFALLLVLLPCSSAQEFSSAGSQPEAAAEAMPQWLIDFSNLSRDKKEQYLNAFSKAKQAYQQGQWVICYGYLSDCETIFRQNPHVWNLCASCLIEQNFLEDAAIQLEKVSKVIPNDPVLMLNRINLHLATKQYEECLALIDSQLSELSPSTPEEVRNVLLFRKVVTLIQLNRTDEARAQVAHLNAMSDTPLYYYSRAAFFLAEGRNAEAGNSLRSAHNIFARGIALTPYQQTLNLSKLAEKASASSR